MRKPLLAALVVLGAMALVGAAAPQEPWTIGGRTLPAPAGASEELRNSISATPAPDVEARVRQVPADEAGWVALQEKRARRSAASVAGLAERLAVSIDSSMVEGVKVYHLAPGDANPRHADHLFVYVHGGGYVFGSGLGGAREAVLIAKRSRLPVLSIDYRMPPKHPFPAAVDDVVAVYRHLLHNRPAESIAIGGTSAGGGLTLAAVHKFLESGLEAPGALYTGTPWADLTRTGDTIFTNEGIDRVLVAYDGLLREAASLYAGGRDLKDPLISPVYGSFQGFPPTYLVTGTRDLFLSDVVRTHRKLREAGVVADLNVYEGMSHAEYFLVRQSPESHQVYAELDAFLLEHLQSSN